MGSGNKLQREKKGPLGLGERRVKVKFLGRRGKGHRHAPERESAHFLKHCAAVLHVRVFHRPLVKFIPKYFILFAAIVSGIVSLISNCPLLMYRNTNDFCMLLYSAVSLNCSILLGFVVFLWIC